MSDIWKTGLKRPGEKNSSAMKTYVPPEMMMEGWTAAHPQTATNWAVERDIFTWLKFGTPVEEVIEMYERWLKKKTANTFSEKVNAYWLVWLYGKCHHNTNTWLKHCPICDEHHKECIQYLRELKERVIRFSKTQEEVRSKWKKEIKDRREEDDSIRYYEILGLTAGASRESVRQRYRELVRVWHPDLYSYDRRLQQVCQDKLKQINVAYEYFKRKYKM
jgi:DnaJ-like protein